MATIRHTDGPRTPTNQSQPSRRAVDQWRAGWQAEARPDCDGGWPQCDTRRQRAAERRDERLQPVSPLNTFICHDGSQHWALGCELTITNISSLLSSHLQHQISGQTWPNKQNADPSSCSSHSSPLQSCQRMLSASITCCQKEDDWVMSNGSLVSNIYHFLLSSDYLALTAQCSAWITNLGCYQHFSGETLERLWELVGWILLTFLLMTLLDNIGPPTLRNIVVFHSI